MATLDEEFAAMQGAQEPSLDQEFASMQAPAPAPEPVEPTIEDVKAINKRRAELRAEEIAAGAFEPGFVERYGLPTAAFLQGFSSAALPFVAAGIEELAGVTPKQQSALRDENPVASGLGTVGGIAAGVIATGGIGGAAEVAGAKAAEAAAAGVWLFAFGSCSSRWRRDQGRNNRRASRAWRNGGR